MTPWKPLLFFTFCTMVFLPAGDGLVFVAPFACPAACAAATAGGALSLVGLQAALVASGIGAPVAAALIAMTPFTAGMTAAGCSAACIAAGTVISCFDEYTRVDVFRLNSTVSGSSSGSEVYLTRIPIAQLQPGDRVPTLDESRPWIQGSPTEVIQVLRLPGTFLFYRIDLETQTTLNVTGTHMMILCDLDSDSLRMQTARGVRVGDSMIVTEDGGQKYTCAKVRKVSTYHARDKINVETRSGTLIANGVFVSGMCDKHAVEGGDVQSLLQEYRNTHYGQPQP